MKRTAFRQKVERILGKKTLGNHSRVFIDNRKVGVRMKFSHVVASKEQMEELRALPHVTKVQNWEGYEAEKTQNESYGWCSYWTGLTIHVDCSTKDIQL